MLRNTTPSIREPSVMFKMTIYRLNVTDMQGNLTWHDYQAETHLFVEQTVDDEEEGALLGVQDYEQDLKEKVCLVETQNPGTAQYDKLGHNLEQNQPAKEKRDFEFFR